MFLTLLEPFQACSCLTRPLKGCVLQGSVIGVDRMEIENSVLSGLQAEFIEATCPFCSVRWMSGAVECNSLCQF